MFSITDKDTKDLELACAEAYALYLRNRHSKEGEVLSYKDFRDSFINDFLASYSSLCSGSSIMRAFSNEDIKTKLIEKTKRMKAAGITRPFKLLEEQMKAMSGQEAEEIIKKNTRSRKTKAMRDLAKMVEAEAHEAQEGLDFTVNVPANREVFDTMTIVNPDSFENRLEMDKPRSNGAPPVLRDYSGLSSDKIIYKADNSFISCLDSLREQFPNFSDVVDDVKLFAIKSKETNTAFHMPPVLLIGPPGIGKSEFMNKLSFYSTLPCKTLNMSGARDTIKLTGLSPSWGNACPSEITKFMAHEQYANPFVTLDELDKSSGRNTGHDDKVQDCLLTLLEPSTSKKFEDAYIGTPTINFSLINFIATANNISDIDDTLLTRFNIYVISDVSKEQKGNIINNIFKLIREEYKANNHVSDVLTEDVISFLVDSDTSLRTIKLMLMKSTCKAIGRSAIIKAMVNLGLEDITEFKKKEKKRQIGFISYE